MIAHIEIAGEALPVNFGLRALGLLSSQLGVDITELGAMMSDNTDIVNKIDAIEAIAVVGLNEGARLMSTGKVFDLQKVDDMLMQDIGAVERILNVFAKSLECVHPLGATSQKKTNRHRPPRRRG